MARRHCQDPASLLGFRLSAALLSGSASSCCYAEREYCSLHGSMFGLSPNGLNLIHYCGIGLVKLVVICFFFFPWLAIRLVLRKAKG